MSMCCAPELRLEAVAIIRFGEYWEVRQPRNWTVDFLHQGYIMVDSSESSDKKYNLIVPSAESFS